MNIGPPTPRKIYIRRCITVRSNSPSPLLKTVVSTFLMIFFLFGLFVLITALRFDWSVVEMFAWFESLRSFSIVVVKVGQLDEYIGWVNSFFWGAGIFVILWSAPEEWVRCSDKLFSASWLSSTKKPAVGQWGQTLARIISHLTWQIKGLFDQTRVGDGTWKH